MKYGAIMIALTFLFTSTTKAQFGKLLDKAKSKTQQRVDRKIDSEMDKALDKAEGKTTTSDNKPAPTTTTSAEEKPQSEENGLKTFSKFDFIPGDSIIYAEDFQQEAIGELPVNWNTTGSGEVTLLDKIPGQWLRLHKQFTYLSSNKKQFGENYTVEFDFVFQLKNNGWGYPDIKFGLFSTKDEDPGSNTFLREYKSNAAVIASILPGEGNSRVRLNSHLENRAYFNGDPKAQDNLHKFWGKPVHVSIQVQKERYRMWINEEKVFDIPKGVPAGHILNQILFEVGHTNYPEDKYAVFVSNIKVATGRPDTRHKLIEEGKFSTTGILFDFQSAVIKPESYGVVKEIAGVLKDNAGVKLKILGHTSSDGDDKANMELSQKRAIAVKDLLTSEFGIDPTRLETEGKGETQPVADNKTKEGKTANRRVEFIKL